MHPLALMELSSRCCLATAESAGRSRLAFELLPKYIGSKLLQGVEVLPPILMVHIVYTFTNYSLLDVVINFT
jgi:hypothetical protein